MIKKVWIINHYAGDTFFDKGGRHYWIAENMKKQGFEPIIFCCNNKHNPGTEEWIDTRKLWVDKISEDIHVPYVFIRGRKYSGNGIRRIINMLDFYRNIKKSAYQYVKKDGKPDVIYASSVHPFALVAGIQLARRFKVKCICEVRDLWPESLVAYNIATKKSIVVKLLRLLEKRIYKKADALIFTMEGAYDYIEKQGWGKIVRKEKVFFVNNGVDIEKFDYNRDNFRIEDNDLKDDEVFKVVYTGSIRKVNGIGKLIDIAQNVKNQRIKFLIWGDGDELKDLLSRVNEKNIGNVFFKGRVEKKYLPYITSCADLNLAHNNSSPIFRYGISFNKIFEYLAAGKPILCDFDSCYNPVVEQKAGFTVKNDSINEIADMIEKIANYDLEYLETMGSNARKAANKYDFSNLTRIIISVFDFLEK